MMYTRFILTLLTSSSITCLLYAQTSPTKILFLGNSYTNVNNLPQLLKDVALSSGDTIITDENTPGGQTLMGHTSNQTSLSKIKLAKWDYVVLQDQSQLPSFPDADVNQMVYPYARLLDSLIDANHACTQTVFYMTWGRKNGDAQNCPFWPPVCTYQGMDSLLALRYSKMADDNKAILSPVGALWKYLRANNPEIELYQSDESHPSVAGSFAAACSFYAVILKKDPTLITYNAGLTNIEALAIKQAAKSEVYQKLAFWNVGLNNPQALFINTLAESNMKLVQLQNQSINADSYLWDFGDGDTSTEVSPHHLYKDAGNYKITLTAYRCNLKSTHETDIAIISTGISAIKFQPHYVYPNPTTGFIYYELPTSFIGSTFQVADVYGKVLLIGVIQSTTGVLSLEKLPAGLYSFQVNDFQQKIVKQ